MTPEEFVTKWSTLRANEIAVSQTHFIDVCDLVGHARPYDGNLDTEAFRFEKSAAKTTGTKGRADVFYQGKFIWEYKGAHANLDKAYEQVLLYRDALGNPPLLIVSDTQRIIIHTNYTNTIRERHEITLDELVDDPDKLNLLKACFAHSDELDATFKPTRTQAQVTKANAQTFISIANELKLWNQDNAEETPEKLAHFIVRVLFCLFAEDMGLLPNKLFHQIVKQPTRKLGQLETRLRNLFETMRDGGEYGFHEVLYFDGNLFEDAYIPSLPGGIGQLLTKAAQQDWREIDPTIFGTLFERIIDPAVRAPLGAHYTSKADILLIVEPVLMQPLRREWDALRPKVKRLARKDKAAAHAQLSQFADKIASTKVLDPACGSGNFLYIALQSLLTLQKEVILYASRNELDDIPLTVSPAQLYGIEINVYAHELAQIVIWIGYLQWCADNGFGNVQEPILQPLNQIERKDAILAYDAEGNPVEPEWPSADVIIGNPPFLGGNRIRQGLEDRINVDELFELYEGKVPAFSDLVTYWFENARRQLENNLVKRVGLITTNSIRGGINRLILERIQQSGNLFMAWSDQAWVLDGAAVRVSIIGFDDGSESKIVLDGQLVRSINSDLTSRTDITKAGALLENQSICYIGSKKAGPFDIDATFANQLLRLQNPSSRPNSDVIFQWFGASAIVRRTKQKYTIYFGEMDKAEAALYEAPFAYVQEKVYPLRQTNRERRARERWWQHRRQATEMWNATHSLNRFIATPRVSKYRLFVWIKSKTMPDDGVYVFAREDDYFFGVLHSKLHELWALRLGTWLGKGNDPRYTPTTTVATYPFPWSPGNEPSEAEDDRVAAIAEIARELVTFRQAWLNPSAPINNGIDVAYHKILKKRTLTNMYNALQHYRAALAANELHSLEFRSGWKKAVKSDFTREQAEELHDIHTELDHAVLDAYGWSHTLTDEQILERLLALNLERAALNHS